MEQVERMKEWGLIGIAGGIASLGGLAQVLKVRDVTPREILRAVLTSFAVGVIFALLSYPLVLKAPDFFLTWLGLVGLAGFGGASVLDFLLTLGKRYLQLRVSRSGNTPVEKDEAIEEKK